MEKTEFEIRESVLAHCTHLLGEIQVEGKKPYPEYPDISCFIDDGVIANYTVWPFGDHSSFFIIIYTDRAVVDDQWKKAYRLLGLDKRDALEAERGKSAKLVEAFEEIKAMKIYGDDDTDQGFESESDAYHEIKHLAKNTLEAYKEGKKDE